MERLWDLLARLPSTNARIAVTLLLWIATGVKAIWTWTAPPWEWLLALFAMAGLDTGQFFAKRATQHRPPNGGGHA